MRRTLVASLAAFLALAGPAAAQGTADPVRPPLKAMLAACSTGPTEDERFAVFTGSMPAYRGTKRMAMRFDLLMRPIGATSWTLVKSKGFGRWERSKPGVGGFVWTKRVERLQQGAEYRVGVRFRWYQAGTGRRADRIRRSPLCVQPDQRPNLRAVGLAVLPPRDGLAGYRVTIVNAGRTAAGAFDVRLESSQPDDVRTIASLPPGEQATVELRGGRCDEAPVLVVIDPRRVVDESDEADNRTGAACGATAPTG